MGLLPEQQRSLTCLRVLVTSCLRHFPTYELRLAAVGAVSRSEMVLAPGATQELDGGTAKLGVSLQ
jgi:hypothetical protein